MNAVTCHAYPTPIFDLQVVAIEGVSIVAMRSSRKRCRNGLAAKRILSMTNSLIMVRVYALPDPAKMIQFADERTNQKLPNYAMCGAH